MCACVCVCVYEYLCVCVTWHNRMDRREGGRRRRRDSETYVESTRMHLSSSKCNPFLLRDPPLFIRVDKNSQKEGGENHRECVPCRFRGRGRTEDVGSPSAATATYVKKKRRGGSLPGSVEHKI